MDVWFCRYYDRLWCVTAKHDEPPTRKPFKVRASARASDVLRRMTEQGYEVEQVGICPPDMLGLE
jgi:hypothetical protein